MSTDRVIVPRNRANPRTHCSICGVELSAENAYIKTGSTTWRDPCKACLAVKRRAMHDDIEDESRFMLTRDVCDICGQPERHKRNGVVKRLAKDHDHRTGAWRGLLCHRCNMAIGLFADNPQLLASAIKYLESPPGLFLLEE